MTESLDELSKLLGKCSVSSKPRINMLLAIVNGIVSTNELAHKTRSNRDSVHKWKNTYRSKGLEGLLAKGRGGNRPGHSTMN